MDWQVLRVRLFSADRGRYEDAVDLAGDVAFQAADDLGLGQSFLGSAFGVGAASWVVAEPVEHDDVEGFVGVAVPASVEPVSMDAAAAGRDRRDTAQVSERGFGGDPVRVVAGAGQELAGHLGPDAGKGEQRRARPRQPTGRSRGRLR